MSDIFPRQNGKSTLTLNIIKKQLELNEAIYKNYTEKEKNDLLLKENKKLKELLKECKFYIGYDTYEFDEKVNKLITKIDEVLK